MESQILLLLLAVLACPIRMGVMMWMMNRNMGSQQGQSMLGHNMAHNSEADRLKSLREQRRLEKERPTIIPF